MRMIEYVKLILDKVSFDKRLFEKELIKGIQSLVKEEIIELKEWCYARFGKVYQAILNKVFKIYSFT